MLLLLLALSSQAAADPPAFKVIFADAQVREHAPRATAGGAIPEFRDDRLTAQIRAVDAARWELKLTLRAPAAEIWFPWSAQQDELDGTPSAEVLYPYAMGVARSSDQLREWSWEGQSYPGPLFAPLAIVNTSTDARIVAATNWPPRRVHVLYSRGRVALRYNRIPAGELTLGAIVARAPGDASRGRFAWHTLVDQYRDWLIPQMTAAGLRFDQEPAWLRDMHGLLNVQLENMDEFRPADVRRLWQRWRRDLPWVQFWGQMSHYAGPAQHARPPRGVNEETGCCLPLPRVHPRYVSELPQLATEIRAAGGRVGYYVRPKPPPAPLTESANRAFLTDWMKLNAQLVGANAHYIDTLCGHDFGEPLEVARLVAGLDDAIVEFAVDVYPAASLMSGCLTSGDWRGGPGRSARAHGKATFPQLGRYLLRERSLFLGASNDDHKLWGPAAEYWVERQAFLLGCKLDVQAPTEGDYFRGPDNRALRRILDLRTNVGWWRREPRYLDQRGLSDISAGIDVRRFATNTDEHLLVIDNWKRRRDASFAIEGQRVAVPDEPLSILAWRPR